MYVKEKCTGETAAKVGACILNFVQDDCQQGYHSLPETWQKNYGYTRLYDDVFRVGSNMDVYPSEAIVDGKKYVLWLWKGDYWDLGTGAEIGLYTTAKESTSSNPARVFGKYIGKSTGKEYGAQMLGTYATTEFSESIIDAKNRLALLPQWKNTKMYGVKFCLPKGNVINVGIAAP